MVIRRVAAGRLWARVSSSRSTVRTLLPDLACSREKSLMEHVGHGLGRVREHYSQAGQDMARTLRKGDPDFSEKATDRIDSCGASGQPTGTEAMERSEPAPFGDAARLLRHGDLENGLGQGPRRWSYVSPRTPPFGSWR